jgi:small GTP-binding protein
VFDLSLNGELHTVKLIDTAGQEEYERVRKCFYQDADCFILCYDVSNRDSFNNIDQKWLPELRTIDKWPIPVNLVGIW